MTSTRDDTSISSHEENAIDRYQHLIEHVQDAVVEFELVDGEPVVREINQSFVDVFGYDRSEVENDPLNDWIVPAWLADEAAELDERTARGEINYRRVKRETADGLREFLYRGIPYEEHTAPTGGFAVYTDITEITRHERRLRVLNRILRHNLRNSANVILGHTTRLLDQLDEQTAEMTESAAAVEAAADDLEALAREASNIDAISRSADDDHAIDCVPLVLSVARERRQRAPHAEIETVVPDSMEVSANTHLQSAIDSLVDNAIRHHTMESPHVRIRVEQASADDWVSIHVEDNNHEIPVHEREIVAGESEVTELNHGTGLGLWLARWTVDAFGGHMSFGTSDLGGNDICLRLPRS